MLVVPHYRRGKLQQFTFGYIDPETGERCGPQPKQALLHTCPADWTFYGGAIGGGKSEGSIVEAIGACLEHPGCEVAVFRRKHTELKKSLIQRFHALVPSWIAKYNKTDGVATFFSGSLLWFCHCQHESSVYDYQSAQWLRLHIDESSHFTQYQFDYLETRVRSINADWRERTVLTSNPGNVGHGWHKRYFIAPVPEELGNRPRPNPLQVWRPLPLRKEDGSFIHPPEHSKTRCFIPAYFRDNFALAKARPGYLAAAYRLGGDRGRQLAEGDWDANDSMIVGPSWRESYMVTEADTQLRHVHGLQPGAIIPWHVVRNSAWRPPDSANVYGSVDYGYGAPWAFYLSAALSDQHVRTFHERYASRVRDVDQAVMIRDDIKRLMAQGMPRPEWIVCDPAMKNSRAEMGISKSILEVYEEIITRDTGVLVLPGAAGRGARVSRPQRWLDALQRSPDGLPYWSVTTACPNLIRSVPEVPWDEEDPEVEDDESENHAYESLGRLFEARPIIPAKTEPDPYLGLDPLSAAHHRAQDARLNRKPGALDARGFGLH